MADSTQVNVRYSNILLARIDSAAGEGKRSEWILEACRMRLEGSRGIGEATSSSNEHELPDSSKLDMQDLRDICAGKPAPFVGIPVYLSEITICGKTWWEDGEHYECLMDKGHREQKHGLRGMVRRLDA
jgi:hypothetical protein